MQATVAVVEELTVVVAACVCGGGGGGGARKMPAPAVEGEGAQAGRQAP